MVYGFFIYLLNLLGWWSWNSWHLRILSVLAFIGTALLLALAQMSLSNLTYIFDPMKMAGGILLFLFASVLAVTIRSRKRIIFSCILLTELLVLSFLAAMPLHTYYTGQDIVLKTLPMDQEDRYSFDRGLVPTDYGIFKSSPNLKAYHAGEDVYLILKKQKEGYWAVEQITKYKPKSDRLTFILPSTVIKDSEKPGGLFLDK